MSVYNCDHDYHKLPVQDDLLNCGGNCTALDIMRQYLKQMRVICILYPVYTHTKIANLSESLTFVRV